tara:strand:- start:277 stop:1410 length:1134 start_codon:yes stop_codon:yes gene_type:complete
MDSRSKTVTAHIPASSLEDFKYRLKAVNKRAQKIGTEKAEITNIDYNVSPETKFQEGEVFQRDMVAVSYYLPDIRIQGYTLAGIITRDEMDVISINDRHLIDFSAYRNPDFRRCDHCGVRHKRRSIIVVQDDLENEIVVGKTCLKDFMGVTPSAYYKFVTELDMLMEFEKEDAVGYHLTHSLEDYLVKVCYIANNYGFTTAQDYLEIPTYHEAHTLKGVSEEALEAKRGMAKDIISFVRNAKEENDYFFNLKQAFANDRFMDKKSALVASAYKAFQRNLKEKKKATNPSEYIGNVGEKITAKVTITFIKNCGSFAYNGPDSYNYKMTDEEGNLLSVFTSSKKFQPEVGDSFFIEAKVKKHEVFAGEKITQVSHIKSI